MIRSLIRFAIEKSILNHIFLLFLVVLGIFSYIQIPKEIFPPSNLDAISISGAYEGTSPEVLDRMAVKVIEEELINLSDIERLESTVKNGTFSITAYLKESADKNELLDDIKDIVAVGRRDLPSDMNEPVVKIVKQAFPLVVVAIASNESKEAMLKVASALKSDIAMLPNLSEIRITGDADKELVLKIDEKKLSAYGLGVEEVYSALSNLSTTFPIGLIKERGKHLFISTLGGEQSVKAIEESWLSVGTKKIQLKEIAKASFMLEDAKEASHFNGKPNLSITINKSKEGNAIELVKQIKTLLKQYESSYQDYEFKVYSDTSIWIRNRLNTVVSNIIFGLVLVGFSVYMFINARVAFVVTIGIPVSFLIGLIASQMLGYSLNMLSLLGVLMALGMLVDEAIVVSENIYRHLEMGEDIKTATIEGAAEMFPAVLTATMTTIFAFLPLLMMSGEMGLFMRILPLMISLLLLSSLFEAFYFLPLHAKDFIKLDTKKRQNHSWWLFWNGFYHTFLSKLFTYPKRFLVLFLLFTLGGTFWMIKTSQFQLFPEFDNTQIFINGKVNINHTVEETQEMVGKIEAILLQTLSDDEVSSITSTSGFLLDAKYKPQIAENNFQIFINLYEAKPQNVFDRFINPYISPSYDDSDMRRDRPAKAILGDVKKALEGIEKSGEFEEFQVIVPGAGVVKTDIDIALSGNDALIQDAMEELVSAMRGIKGVSNVASDLKEGQKELKIRVNGYGQSLGFNEKNIASILRGYFFKVEVSKMNYEGELIRVKTQERMKDTFDALFSFYVTIPQTAQKVRLSEIVDLEEKQSYADVHKEKGIKISSLTGSIDKAVITSSEVMKIIEPTLARLAQKGLHVEIKGEEKENKKVQLEMAKAGLVAIFLIFIALVWMFDSLFLSFIVLSVIPLSVFGALLGHGVMGLNLSMTGLLGIVGLSGVVVNDGIVMIDFLKKAQSIKEALDIATTRLRPIFLTSITTVFGLTTLIFFADGQSVILQPMAVSLGFGVVWSTLLNLLYLPVLYVLLKRKTFDTQ